MARKQTDIVVEDFQKGYLTLPFDESQFRDFISSLLGQPQTIGKKIEGKFEIHLKDLQNFNDLINQRVTQQNAGRLIQVKTQILFSDNSSVLLGSLSELLTYNEVKPIVSQQVIMTWTYLIQFSDKNTPEKQEIELKISTKGDQRSPVSTRVYPILLPVIVETEENPYFEINVRHTARSWGNDIETLLTNQINSILLKKNHLKQIVDKYRGSIVVLSISGLSYAGIYSVRVRNEAYLKSLQEIVRPVTNAPNLGSKINYLVNFTTSDHTDFFSANYGFAYILVGIFAFTISFMIIELIDFKEKSFIVLTRESVKKRDEILLNQKNRGFAFVISYLLSIIASIIASFLYAHFTK